MFKALIAVAFLSAAMLLGASGAEAHGYHHVYRAYGWHHHGYRHYGFRHHGFHRGFRHHWGHRRFGWHHRHHAELQSNPASGASEQPLVASGRLNGGTSGGMASWYPGRAGGFTAAHRFWPFGTRVLVTNRSNGRSVVVRINDRGPFVRGRVIDLNRASATAIGVTGVSPVTLQRL